MKFFKRKPNKEAEGTFSARLNQKIIQHQQKIADYLNEKTSFLSGKTLLFLLMFFCILFGSYCLYLISGTFN